MPWPPLTWPCPRAFAPTVPSVQIASIRATLPQDLICEALTDSLGVADKYFPHEAAHQQLSELPNPACEAGNVQLGSFLECLGVSRKAACTLKLPVHNDKWGLCSSPVSPTVPWPGLSDNLYDGLLHEALPRLSLQGSQAVPHAGPSAVWLSFWDGPGGIKGHEQPPFLAGCHSPQGDSTGGSQPLGAGKVEVAVAHGQGDRAGEDPLPRQGDRSRAVSALSGTVPAGRDLKVTFLMF